VQYRIHRFGDVDSTSERAFAALRDGSARDGDVFVAQSQSAGRGRLGRRWHSAPNEGLYTSVVLEPPVPLSAPGLTIAVGLAALDAVRALGLVHARSKWPNDVVVPIAHAREDAKLAGVLVETRGFDAARPQYVAGIGINVAQRGFPPELEAERAVTSLLLCGIETNVDAVLGQLLGALSDRIAAIRADPASLERDFVAAIGLDRARVRVATGEETLVGRFMSLRIDAGIAIAIDGGERRVPLEIVREIAVH
jgi:biotin-[acetyl-CoA-carboxylase] ligase BirA-like protein